MQYNLVVLRNVIAPYKLCVMLGPHNSKLQILTAEMSI